MTNDTSTLNGALNELGETLADNLSQMGVGDATANDGLTTLAGKILDIEPSIAGLELSTSIDCNVSSNKILLGQSVVFSATLSASYDDTSIEDIDISGVLTGATVLFKTSDGTIIGSGVTDVNGVATYTHTIEEISNIIVYSEFEGSTNFSSCISQNDVTVECSYDFDVTVDKEILSANDNDVATFNCRLSDGTGGVVGESIDYRILHNDIVLSSGSRVTGENGEITLEYAATGVGNVDVIFSLRSILQETYELQDCNFYDLASQSNLSKYTANGDTNITYDSTNSAYLLQKATFGFSSITLNDYRFTNNIKIEADIMLTGSDTNIQCGIGLLNGNIGVDCKLTYYSPDSYYALTCIESTRTSYGSNEVESRVSSIMLNNWYHYIVEINGSNINVKVYDGDVLFATLSTSKSVLNETNNELAFWIGFGINSKALIKNIKVKAL